MKNKELYVVTGITGQVGGAVANTLLNGGKTVRAVVRDAGKGDLWAARGCEVAVAEMSDSVALANAFQGAEGLFLLMPPNFDPGLDFPQSRLLSAARAALEKAPPEKVVYLSTIGAQATQENLLSQHGFAEQLLAQLPIPITFLRPAWFAENFRWDLPSAREKGFIHSFLQPLNKPFPVVATSDVGFLAGELLQERWSGSRTVELEGPQRVTPNEVAETMANIIGRTVRAEVIPRASWEELFKAQGMKNPQPRIRMLDGFNEGWIEFESGIKGSRKGRTGLEEALERMILGDKN